MNASNPAGLDPGWGYRRYRLAQHWGIPPWEVDASPKGEIQEALLIMSLENKAQQARSQQQKPRKYG